MMPTDFYPSAIEPEEIGDLKVLLSSPRLSLGNWPTPLQLNNTYLNFAVKRDDLSGYGRGGIKTRKLEGGLARVLARGHNHILTIVPNISNLKSDLELFASRQSGMQLHMIVANDPYLPEEKRKLIDRDKPFDYSFTGGAKWQVAVHYIRKYIQLRLKGIRDISCYLPSLAHPASVAGAARGLVEMYEQYRQSGRELPKHVFISASTGCSAAGLILAARILRDAGLADITVHTTRVFPGNLRLWIWGLLQWTIAFYDLKVRIKRSDIPVHLPFKEVAYGKSNATLRSICERVKADFDLDIDPIYGARSWTAMEEFMARRPNEEGVVFWHCGFTSDWKIFE